MSVMSQIITAITNANIETYEGTVEQILREKPKYSRFACVIENDCEIVNSLDGVHQSELIYTITIQTYVRKPSVGEAWTEARLMRDTILDTLEDTTFDRPVFLQQWERADRATEGLDAGYEISITYSDIRA